MSSFHDALQATLSCPKCPAQNRPGATLIELSNDRLTAFCSVCATHAPIEKFQLKEKP